MKKIIRLTESDLHRIVKESVKRILKEGKTGVFNDSGEYIGHENHEDFGGEIDDYDHQFEQDDWYGDLMIDLESIAREKVVNILKEAQSLSVFKNGYGSDDEYIFIDGEYIIYRNDIDELIYDLYDGKNPPSYNWSPDMQEVEFKFEIRSICKEAMVGQ